MFGFRFVKFEPSTYVLRMKAGKLIQKGEGLSFWYFVPSTSLIAVPTGSSDVPFIFAETTVDFQEVSIQGQIIPNTTKILLYEILGNIPIFRRASAMNCRCVSEAKNSFGLDKKRSLSVDFNASRLEKIVLEISSFDHCHNRSLGLTCGL